MSEKTHNIVYKTTNLINGKIYIGVHSTDDLNDAYLGSGRIFIKALRKHGKENFTREVLFDFKHLKNALKKEETLVSDDFVSRDDNYNYAIGGVSGGGKSNLGRKMSKEAILKRSKNRPPHKEETKIKIGLANKGKKRSKKTIEENSRLRKKFYKENEHPNKGKSIHSIAVRKKISEKHKGKRLSDSTKEKIRIANIGKHGDGKAVINIKTGKIYPTVTIASEKEDISSRTLWRWLKKGDKYLKYA